MVKLSIAIVSGICYTLTMKGVYKMTFDELMKLREYLVSASKRLTALQYKCGIGTFDQWQRFRDSWYIVREFMLAHPELP